MKQPKTLKGHGKAFWQANAPEMLQDGRLRPVTLSAFVMLCETWELYQTAKEEGEDRIRLVALLKQVQNQMTAFGMTPSSRRRLKLDEKVQKSTADTLREIMGEHAEEDEADEADQSRVEPTANPDEQ